MRTIVSALLGTLLGLTAAVPVAAQTPPAILQPGSPEAPEARDLLPLPLQPTMVESPVPSSPVAPPAALPAPNSMIQLGPRHACVTPKTRGIARAEGGFIDVTVTQGALSMVMTGTSAANAYLGCTGSANETFQLIQELEINCDDQAERPIVLTLESILTGFVRSKKRASASVRLAEVSVRPENWVGPSLALAHPPLGVSDTLGRLCNQRLPPCKGVPMPPGRFILTARFEIDASASGLCDAHAVADFAPDTKLPADWLRTRDPFQGVSKTPFGFKATLTAAPAPDPGRSPFAGTVRVRPLSRQVQTSLRNETDRTTR